MIAALSSAGRRRRALLVALPILSCVGWPALAEPAELHSRFGYCAPPFAPSCVAAAGQDGRSTEPCEQQVERYVASVFAYRACMAAETERAVREANATIQSLRCARDPALCPKPQAEPQKEKSGKIQRKAKIDN